LQKYAINIYLFTSLIAITLISGGAIKSGDFQPIFMSIISVFIIYYIYQYILKPKQGKNEYTVMRGVVLFNILILFLFYLFSLEIPAPRNILKVSFAWGNFMDFMAMIDTAANGTYQWAKDGYAPFAYAISKFVVDGTGAGIYSLSSDRIYRFTYLVMFFLFVLPYLFLLKKLFETKKLNNNNKLLTFAFIFMSYPFFVSLERGNFSFITASLLTLFCIFYSDKKFYLAAIILGVVSSIKVFNFSLMLIGFFALGTGFFLLSIVSFFVTTLASLIYLFGNNFSEFLIFKNTLFAPINSEIIFSDANKVFATTSWDSFRSLLNLLYGGHQNDMSSHSIWFSRLSLVAGIVLLVLTLMLGYKKLPWYILSIAIISIPQAFHYNSGDYNLIILVPFIIALLMEKNEEIFQQINLPIFKFLSIIFLLVSGVAIFEINCCNVVGRSIHASIKSFLIPLSLTMSVMYMIFFSLKKSS